MNWSHYYELLKIDDDLARKFYEKQAITENWTIRELRRQKKTGLFHRIAIGKDKENILKLSKQGQIVKSDIQNDIKELELEIKKKELANQIRANELLKALLKE